MSYMQQYGNLTDKFANQTWDNKWGSQDCSNPNYIDWITYDIRQIPEYKDCTFYFEDNNNVAATSQENIFTNENQNDIDILKESSKCDDNSNIVDEYYIQEQNNDMPQLSNILEEDNISEEDPSDLYNELILEEDFKKREKEIKQIQKEIKKLNRQELLLQNEEREIELLLQNEKQELLELVGPNDNMRNKNQEQQDNTMNKYNSDEPKDTDEKEPSDNMRNRKKTKTYDYNLSLPPPIKTVKNEQIVNKGSTLDNNLDI